MLTIFEKFRDLGRAVAGRWGLPGARSATRGPRTGNIFATVVYVTVRLPYLVFTTSILRYNHAAWCGKLQLLLTTVVCVTVFSESSGFYVTATIYFARGAVNV